MKKRLAILAATAAMAAAMMAVAGPAMAKDVSQEFEQEAESGDVDQSFKVSGGGDNSNQSAGVQGVSNTGSLQSAFGITQFDSEIDEFEIDDFGSDIDLSSEFWLESDQEINQSAASG